MSGIFGGGGDINVPPPSEEEKALQAEQVELLRFQRDALSEQLRQQELLSPLLFESAGIQPTLDSEGRVIGFTSIDDPQAERRDELEGLLLERAFEQFNDPQRKELEELFIQRSLAAARGDLPVTEGP